MVAGKPAGGRSNRSGRNIRGSWSRAMTTRLCSWLSFIRPPGPHGSDQGSATGDLGVVKPHPVSRSGHNDVAGNGSGWSSDRLLGPVRCGDRSPCTSGPSTWSSSRSLRSNCCWKPRLGGGFALRCLQRLSGPDLATRRCPERDSRHTRGRSSPILSY